MKISWNCLNQLIDLTNISHTNVAEKLILAGFETENIRLNKNIQDIILEIHPTANRLDITSLIDIAVEISTLINRPLKIDKDIQKNHQKHSLTIKSLISNEITAKFNKFNLCIIPNLQLAHKCQSIQDHLLAYEIKSRHNLLDVVEFVNLKWGQNIKAYTFKGNPSKLHKISNLNNDIDNQSEQDFLNNTCLHSRLLTEINLLKNTYEPWDLNNILLVNYEYKTKKQLETCISNIYTLHAYKEIAYLINSNIRTNRKFVQSIVYMHNNKHKQERYIRCAKNKIHQILGPIYSNTYHTYLNDISVIHTLQSLNFTVETTKDIFKIQIPRSRQKDIQQDIDIIEELGRIHGFHKFTDKLPIFQKKDIKSKNSFIHQKIRKILRSIGLHEVVNYSLDNYISDNSLKIVNPLNKDQEILRKNLVDNLISAKLYNTNQSNHTFEVFEIGKVFNANTKSFQSGEQINLAGLLGSQNFNRSTWQKASNALSWFQAKGQLEEFFERLHAVISWSTDINNCNLTIGIPKYIHAQQILYIQYSNQVFGLLGKVSQKATRKLGISYPIYLFEINIAQLIHAIKTPKHIDYNYATYSNYPKVTRDISIRIDNHISMSLISTNIQALQQNQMRFLESIKLLSEYYGKNGSRVISFRLTYRSKDKTLTTQEVEILDNIFKSKLNSALNLN